MVRMSNEWLREKIDSFDYWHYPFDLGGGVVIKPTHDYRANKVVDLQDFVWPVVLDLCGGSLAGLRVLDIACNAGFWSLEAHKAGADQVVGFDARAQYVEQATLVRDAMGIDPKRVEYKHMDIYDLSLESVVGEYDLVLLFRVLNHLSNPLLALKKIREVCRGCLVADIRMVNGESPVFYVSPEHRQDGPVKGVDIGLALRPSQSAVELMLAHSGFGDVTAIPARSPLPESYFNGGRALFTARVSDDGTH